MAVDEIGHCAHLMNRFLGSLTQKKEEVARAITAEHGMMFIHASGVRRHTEQKSIMQRWPERISLKGQSSACR